MKNLTSQYKSIISEANISDEFIYTLEYKVDTIESIIIDELKIDNKKHTPDNESYKEICYIPSEEKHTVATEFLNIYLKVLKLSVNILDIRLLRVLLSQ